MENNAKLIIIVYKTLHARSLFCHNSINYQSLFGNNYAEQLAKLINYANL